MRASLFHQGQSESRHRAHFRRSGRRRRDRVARRIPRGASRRRQRLTTSCSPGRPRARRRTRATSWPAASARSISKASRRSTRLTAIAAGAGTSRPGLDPHQSGCGGARRRDAHGRQAGAVRIRRGDDRRRRRHCAVRRRISTCAACTVRRHADSRRRHVLLAQWRHGIDVAGRVARNRRAPADAPSISAAGSAFPISQATASSIWRWYCRGLARASPGQAEVRSAASPTPASSSSPAAISPGPADSMSPRVNASKISRGTRFLITDGGMHHHLAASGNLGQVIKRDYPVIAPARMDATACRPATIVGPLCTPLDTLARKPQMPDSTRRRPDRRAAIGRLWPDGEPSRLPEPQGSGRGACG